MPHLNYSLLAWGTKSNKIELLQKKAIKVLYSKTPIAHTAPLFIKMKQPKLSDLYTCHLLKLYHTPFNTELYHVQFAQYSYGRKKYPDPLSFITFIRKSV